MSASQIRMLALAFLFEQFPSMPERERHDRAQALLDKAVRMFGSQYVYVPATADPFITATEDGRQLVMELRAGGASVRAIAKVIGTSAKAVQNCISIAMDGIHAAA